MSTIGTKFNLLDIAKGIGGDQPVLVDALFKDGAGATFQRMPFKPISGWTEKFTQKTGRPTVAWRNLGEGVTPSKGERKAMQEGVFLLSGVSEIDKVKADSDPRGVKAASMEEDEDFLEAMGHQLSYQLFYGNAAKTFSGLRKRLTSTHDTYVSAGAATETMSIYAIKFGPRRFSGIYNPLSGGKIIQSTDYGAQIVTDSNDDKNEVYQTFFNAAIGIAQYHPKSIGRIALIDSSNKPSVSDFHSLFNKMGMRPDILVCNDIVAGYINELKQSSMRMTPSDTSYNIQVSDYNGIPIIVDTELLEDESTLD